MKKLILLSITLSCLFFSCKKPVANYAILSGTVKNLNGKEITIYSIDSTYNLKTLPNNTFNDTIYLVKPEKISLTLGFNSFEAYLKPGMQLKYNIDGDDFLGGTVLTNDETEINNYLLEKSRIENEELADLSSYDDRYKEDSLIKKLNSYCEYLNKQLDSNKNIPETFKELEKRNINYFKLLKLDFYRTYRNNISDEDDYELPLKYENQLQNLNFTKNQDFNYSSAYQVLVFRKLNDLARKNVEKNEGDINNELIKLYKQLPEGSIRNELIYQQMSFFEQSENIVKAYQDFISISTNKKHIEDINKRYNKFKQIAKGMPSPTFENFENYFGGKASLKDYLGSYIYVDLWATWCAPCIAEIPYLRDIEKKYHDKNIKFISISLDEKRDKWYSYVKENNLAGIQLIANQDSPFMKDYLVKLIPRFILINTEGQIVDAYAPKPSDEELKMLLNKIL